jgi:hypothetical protein
MARFQTVRRRARFAYYGLSSDAMQRIAETTRGSVISRIQRGETVNDSPARPLSMKYKERWENHRLVSMGADRGYRAQKQRKGGRPIRDWTYTGHTLRCLKVAWVTANRAAISFLNVIAPWRRISAAKIAAIRNADERQFGVSPKDRQNMMAAVHREVVAERPVRPQALEGTTEGAFLAGLWAGRNK